MSFHRPVTPVVLGILGVLLGRFGVELGYLFSFLGASRDNSKRFFSSHTVTNELLLFSGRGDNLGDVVEGLAYFPLLQVHIEVNWYAADAQTGECHERAREVMHQVHELSSRSCAVNKRLSSS